MPVNPPGLGFMDWARRMTAEDPRIARLRAQGLLEPQDEPGLAERMARMAGGALPWVPGQAGVSPAPEDMQAYGETPYLAQLGRVAGFGSVMRGGIGSPRWLLNPRKLGPSGEAIRPTVTPEMVTAARAGDETARAAVIDGLQDMIAKTARKYVKAGQPLAEFEDLMAQGNLTALKVLNAEKAPDDFLAYVRAAIDDQIKRFAVGQRKITQLGTPIEGQPGLEDVAARVPDIPRAQLNQILNAAMTKLTEAQRSVVTMHLGLGEFNPMELKDIATTLGKTHEAARLNLKGGLNRLKIELKKAGIEVADLVPETQNAPPTRIIKTPAGEAGAATELPPGVRPIRGGSDAGFDPYGNPIIPSTAPELPTWRRVRIKSTGQEGWIAGKKGTYYGDDWYVINPNTPDLAKPLDWNTMKPSAVHPVYDLEDLGTAVPDLYKKIFTPISGGSEGWLPPNPKAMIEKLGLKYEGATPGLKPGDPEMHWFTDPTTQSTGLVKDAKDWEELMLRFQKPISGASDEPGLGSLGAYQTPMRSVSNLKQFLTDYGRLQSVGGGSYQGPLKRVTAIQGMEPFEAGVSREQLPDIGGISDRQKILETLSNIKIGDRPLSNKELTNYWWPAMGDRGYFGGERGAVGPARARMQEAMEIVPWGPEYLENYPNYWRRELLRYYGKEFPPEYPYPVATPGR